METTPEDQEVSDAFDHAADLKFINGEFNISQHKVGRYEQVPMQIIIRFPNDKGEIMLVALDNSLGAAGLNLMRGEAHLVAPDSNIKNISNHMLDPKEFLAQLAKHLGHKLDPNIHITEELTMSPEFKAINKVLGKPFGQHGSCAMCKNGTTFEHLFKVNLGEYAGKDLCGLCYRIAKDDYESSQQDIDDLKTEYDAEDYGCK